MTCTRSWRRCGNLRPGSGQSPPGAPAPPDVTRQVCWQHLHPQVQVCSPPLGEGGRLPAQGWAPRASGPDWGVAGPRVRDPHSQRYPLASGPDLELYSQQDLGSVVGSDAQFSVTLSKFPAPYLNIPNYKTGLITDPPNRLVRIKSCIVTKHSNCTCHMVSSWQVFAELREKR